MQFSTLTVTALSIIGASASSAFCKPGQWTLFGTGSNIGFYITGSDDTFEGLPAFAASCVTSGRFSCNSIDGPSYIGFTETFGLGPGNWTFTQQYNGHTATATADFWSPTSIFTYVTPTLVA